MAQSLPISPRSELVNCSSSSWRPCREFHGGRRRKTKHSYVTERENDQIYYRYEFAWIETVFSLGGHNDLREAARTIFDEYPTDDLGELTDRDHSEYLSMARNPVH